MYTPALTGGGAVLIGDGAVRALQVGRDSGSGTFSGVISNAVSFEKIGVGIQYLSGANTYTGDTVINEGTIRLSGATATLGLISAAANTTTIRQAGVLDVNGAGAVTALYSGGIEIIGERNAPALHDIAWYGGNSGVGFDLPEGHDSSDWKEMQYPNPKSGTREVGQKQPNPWGLYDMLGNVWEWVEDPWHPNYELAPNDGSLWQSAEAGAGRVLRGGSWNDFARVCRSASRLYGPPDDRDGVIGFRCARVQA